MTIEKIAQECIEENGKFRLRIVGLPYCSKDNKDCPHYEGNYKIRPSGRTTYMGGCRFMPRTKLHGNGKED